MGYLTTRWQQVAVTDNTMSGNGTAKPPLKVDTSLVATKSDLDGLGAGITYAPLGGLEDDEGAALSRNNIKKGITLETLSEADSPIITTVKDLSMKAIGALVAVQILKAIILRN